MRIADSSNFNVSTTVAAALVTVRPGGVREMHWHPNADEWQYYIKGKARMTVFNTGPNAMTMDFNAGDIGYVKTKSRALCREHRRHRPAVHRRVQGSPLRRDLPVQLADPYASRAGGPASQCRRSDDREVARQRSGRHAQIVACGIVNGPEFGEDKGALNSR